MRTLIAEAAARAAHEANRAFRIAHGEGRLLPHWEQVPEEDKQIVIRGVQRVSEGCGARELHESWVHDKLARGWLYGSRRDPMAKVHPELVSWDELSPLGREKSILFAGVVRAVLACFPERMTLPVRQQTGRVPIVPGAGKGRRL